MWLPYLRAIFSNIVVALAAVGMGWPLIRMFPRTLSQWEVRVCSWIGGFGLLGLALFVVGQWRFTRGLVAWFVAAAAAFGAIRLGRFERKDAKGKQGSRKMPVAAAAIVALVLAVTAIGGLAEPVGTWETDGVAYHYVGAKVWLRDGILRPIPDNAPTSYPRIVEIVFAALADLGGDRAAGLSAAVTLGLLLAMAGALAKRCGAGNGGAWWAAALVAAMPALYEGAHSGFIDAIYASFVLAAARIGFDAEKKREFAALGIFCGLAMATKYPGLTALPLVLVCAVWPRRGSEERSSWAGAMTAGMTAAGVAGAIALPVYLSNWIFLGSPIYPPPAGALRFLQAKYFSAGALREFYAWSIRRGNGHGRGLLQLAALPFNLTYHTADFHGAGGIGIAPLALAPFGVLTERGNAFAKRLAVLGVLLTVMWFVTMQESRYLIHVYVIAAVFAVIGWRYVAERLRPRGRALGAVVVAISIAYGLFMITKARLADVHAAVSPAFAEVRHRKGIPFVESFEFLNRDPEVRKVLILDRSVPAYYSDKDYVKPFGQWGEQVLPDARRPEDVLKKVNELRVTHILDVESTISGFLVPPGYPGLRLVFERPGQRVYEVEATK
ncbi:MAG TPA: glycosyltransferase family 39 protein [Bryobacteraceae bacterium]|nr:glycosyltransferase family 39 protein [Bryobacteraceae bacterium]